MSFVKKHAIRDLDAATAAQDIDDNFDAIFATLRSLQNQLAGGVGADGANGRDGKTVVGPPGSDGGDGAPGPPGPRGPAGAAGAAGATGATGPPFPSFIILDGESGSDGYPIPGPRGATGATGATGASASWTLISNTTAAGAAQYDFTGLAGYQEILVLIDGVTRSVSGITSLRVSIDNGANFLTASGDYITVAAVGTESNQVLIPFHNTSATAARSGIIHINLFSSTDVKVATNYNIPDSYFIPTANALNAIRVYSGAAGGNLNAGTILVYGR